MIAVWYAKIDVKNKHDNGVAYSKGGLIITSSTTNVPNLAATIGPDEKLSAVRKIQLLMELEKETLDFCIQQH